MTDITIENLLDLIDGIDEIDSKNYLSICRWDGGSGGDDEEMGQIVRQLARNALGGFPSSDIGDEILRQIDTRARPHR